MHVDLKCAYGTLEDSKRTENLPLLIEMVCCLGLVHHRRTMRVVWENGRNQSCSRDFLTCPSFYQREEENGLQRLKRWRWIWN